MPPCRLRRRNFLENLTTMVHSEVYLNKYVVSIAPFSTPASELSMGWVGSRWVEIFQLLVGWVELGPL